MIVSIYSHDSALFVGALVHLFLVDVLQYRKEVVICRLCILLRRLGLDHASDAVRVEEFDEEAIFYFILLHSAVYAPESQLLVAFGERILNRFQSFLLHKICFLLCHPLNLLDSLNVVILLRNFLDHFTDFFDLFHLIF